MTASSLRRRRPIASGWLLALLAVLLALGPAVARAQDAPPVATFDRWNKLESSEELRNYRNGLRDGTFDESAKNFLRKTALPQLGLPGNRAEIDRVRRKMFDRLCVVDQGADAKAGAVQAAMETVRDFMIAVARDPKADRVHRVNAALLVGEMRVPGNKPWPDAADKLAGLVGDDALDPAVRIAAAAGLARQVDADPAGRAEKVGPVLVTVAGSPLDGMDPVAAEWLRSRTLGMLAQMGAAAPAGAATVAEGILGDAKRATDVRVRAAAVVGRCRKAGDAGDASAAVTAIRELAVASLEAAKAKYARLELAAKLAGGAQAMQPVPAGFGAAAIDVVPQVLRRESWRLFTLADALAEGDGAGLAAVAGPAADAARELSARLREGADRLDTQAEPSSLDVVLESLAAGAGDAAAATAPAAEPEAAAGPPFGNR